MKLKMLGIIALTILFTNFFAFEGKAQNAVYSPYTQSIIPRNNLKIYTWQESGNGIDEKLFNAVINRVESIYAPIVARRGLKLVIERRWTDPTVNAYAERMGTTAHVAMFGGLARHQEVTPDGFALVVCHEIGHHLGGFPKIASEPWASNEGQADYFGTSKCMRKVLRGLDNYNFNRSMFGSPRNLVDGYAREKCYAYNKNQTMADVCVRNAGAAMSLARFFGYYERVTPQFETPDQSRVTRTNDEHPAAQCRLDTYFNGAICPVGDDVDIPDDNFQVGACTEQNNLGFAQRPKCWFATPAQAFRY